MEPPSTPNAIRRPASIMPMSGVRVLDISNFLAAPMCTMFLADFGADVLKVERPEAGDEMRKWGENKNGVGLYYKVINRGKKSITLDLRTPFGVEAVKRLIKDVDIIVENYRTGTLEKWGLGYDVLSTINPRRATTNGSLLPAARNRRSSGYALHSRFRTSLRTPAFPITVNASLASTIQKSSLSASVLARPK